MEDARRCRSFGLPNNDRSRRIGTTRRAYRRLGRGGTRASHAKLQAADRYDLAWLHLTASPARRQILEQDGAVFEQESTGGGGHVGGVDRAVRAAADTHRFSSEADRAYFPLAVSH